MTALALIGAVFGCGLACMLLGIRQRALGLAETVARFDPSLGTAIDPEPEAPAAGGKPILSAVGRSLGRLWARAGRPLMTPEDLAVTDRDAGEQFAAIGLAAVCSGSATATLGTIFATLGLALPSWGVLSLVVAGVALGAVAPGASLRRAAEAERERFVRALGCWLELVALSQAGGMGVESALQASSEISDDAAFARLRAALEQSQLGSMTPWSALARLGRTIGVGQLDELASTLSLAGTEGARVRTTLVAKSASLRQSQLARAEAAANSTTERLFLPSIVLMLAFMIFLMYPAGARLAHIL